MEPAVNVLPAAPSAAWTDLARRLMLRVMFSSALVLIPVVVYRHLLAEMMLPLLTAVFPFAAPDFQLQRLDLGYVGGELVIRSIVMWKHIVFIGGHVIYPDPRGLAEASTLVAHALLGPVIAVILAIAWPHQANGNSLKEFSIRLTALVGVVLLLLLVDVPFVLAGELWQLALDALAPTEIKAVIIWRNFLQGGGRYALAIAMSCAAVWVGRRVAGNSRT